MFLCRVTGTVTATRKHRSFETCKLLIVQPVDVDGEETQARDMLALDPRFSAGVGDVVLVAREGAVAKQVIGGAVPANVVILGVVDGWTHPETT